MSQLSVKEHLDGILSDFEGEQTGGGLWEGESSPRRSSCGFSGGPPQLKMSSRGPGLEPGRGGVALVQTLTRRREGTQILQGGWGVSICRQGGSEKSTAS